MPTTARRHDIEGLRGLAVLLVVCAHAGVSYVRGAFVAVDVFFVLSGFFLTRSLVLTDTSDGDVEIAPDLTGAYARRMLRLLPTLALVLLATLVLSQWLFAPIDRLAIADDVRRAAFFVSNLGFARNGVNYFSAGDNPVLHTWSLGVEYQLHLLWPALLLLAHWWSARRATPHSTMVDARVASVRAMLLAMIIVGVISLAISMVVSADTPMWSYYGPHTRLWEFAAGGIAALLLSTRARDAAEADVGARRDWWLQGIALLLILVPAVIYDRSLPYPGVAALLPVAGTVLWLVAGNRHQPTAIGRAIAIPPLTFLGGISYAWYLWHWPLMVLVATLVPDVSTTHKLLAGGVVGLLLAWITTRWFERPIRSGTLTTRPSEQLYIGAIAVSAAVYFVAQFALSAATASVNTGPQQRFANARDDRMEHKCWAPRTSRDARFDPDAPCAFGDTTSSTTIALFGDSHAEHWLGGFDAAGRAHGWRIAVSVMGGCPIADLRGLVNRAAARRYAACDDWREQTVQRLIRERPSAVVLSSFDHYVPVVGVTPNDFQVSPAAWQEGMRRTYIRFANAEIVTVALRGTPRVPFDVPSCLSRQSANLPFAFDCTYSRNMTFVRDAQQAQNNAARGLPIRFVDMNDAVCDATTCDVMRGGRVMFTDDNHLTASFTRSLAPLLGERVERAMGAR